MSPILFKLYNEYTTTQALEGFGDLKEGGEVIRTVKHENDFVLPTEGETVPQGVFDRLIKIGR